MREPWILAVPAAAAMLFAGAAAAAQSTIDSADRYSYSANAGWMDWRAGDGVDGAVIGRRFASGYIYSANIGWINLGDGSPANGTSYANDAADDFGVNVVVNASGVAYLSGFAWSANAGWVTFYGASAETRPRVDLQTGELKGYVWGANFGWMPLSQSGEKVVTELAAFPIKAEVSMMVMGNTPVSIFSADYNNDGVVDAADVIVAPE